MILTHNFENISSFLHFGYLPSASLDFKFQILQEYDWAKSSQIFRKETVNESILIEEGIRSLRASFDNSLNNIDGAIHIVPLSGGLDSRTILAGLLAEGLKDEIITVTFGTPGTFDYEIAVHVARHFGLRHEMLDLTEINVTQDRLIETAKTGGAWTFLIDAFYGSLVYKTFGKDVVYWSGYMGEALAGEHLPPVASCTWEEAKRYFTSWNRFVRSTVLIPPYFNPESILPFSPLVDQCYLGYDDQLDFACRQLNYIKRVVTSADYDIRTPFLSSEWVNFILGLPHHYRVGKYLYKKILMKAYPNAFSLPTAENLGLPLNASKTARNMRRRLLRQRSRISSTLPNKISKIVTQMSAPLLARLNLFRVLNYIDFDQALRKEGSFKSTIYQNLQDLVTRHIVDWFDIDVMWKEHQDSGANHGRALTLLAALELTLKTYT